jgi:sulfur-oxidizing protein SoxY
MTRFVQPAVLGLLLLLPGVAAAQQSAIDVWETLLKPKYFPDTELVEGRSVIDMKTPYRSEDAAFTPVSIVARIPQTPERYIEKLYLFVENNPQPLVGIFTLTPEMGRADLAMRVRIDKYTNVRAVAVLNDGGHYMVTNFVKAAGGCSAPLAADFEAAMKRIGEMKFRTVGNEREDDLLIGQFMLSHPNVTGMQTDQRTHLIRPEHYVKTIKLYHGDTLLMTAQTGFSVSADPSFRFFFRDTGAHELRAEVVDSKGMSWEQSFDVPG